MVPLIFFFFLNVVFSFSKVHPDAYRTTQEIAVAHGFLCENHTAVTSDGYLLTVFRINSKKPAGSRGPLILQHGLLDTSDTYLINENPALAYLFADNGFDVWLPNFRGNRYSRRHLEYNPDKDSKFWEFSVDEVISMDLKAIFELIVNVTGHEKLHYIGHSMGAGSLIVAASEDPEFYGSHLRSMVALSPAISLVHSEFFAHFAKQFPVHLPFTTRAGEIYLYNLTKATMRQVCHFVPSICKATAEILLGSGKYMNKEKIEVLVSRAPDSTSSALLRHLLQQTEKPGFYHYRKPGACSKKVPYHLEKYPAERIPTLLVSSTGDRMVSHVDVAWLKNTLESNNKKVEYKLYDEIGHITYMVLNKKGSGLYEDLLKFISNHK